MNTEQHARHLPWRDRPLRRLATDQTLESPPTGAHGKQLEAVEEGIDRLVGQRLEDERKQA